MPIENLLTPDFLRRVLWTPPPSRTAEPLTAEVREALAGFGARNWQADLTVPVIVEAILTADAEAAAQRLPATIPAVDLGDEADAVDAVDVIDVVEPD